ncbi:MAG: deoxyhypusine synthase family protein, partial [Candidatus Odinarchaeota archaeon]
MSRRYVKQMKIAKGMTIGDLVKQYQQAGVLGAGRLARAVKIVSNLFQSPEYLVFLAIAGPMVPGGLREIITELVRTQRIHVIVTSG